MMLGIIGSIKFINIFRRKHFTFLLFDKKPTVHQKYTRVFLFHVKWKEKLCFYAPCEFVAIIKVGDSTDILSAYICFGNGERENKEASLLIFHRVE